MNKKLFAGVYLLQKVAVHYEKYSTFFGMFKWWREKRRETVDEWLNVQLDVVPKKVLVNGIEYVPKDD